MLFVGVCYVLDAQVSLGVLFGYVLVLGAGFGTRVGGWGQEGREALATMAASSWL